MSDIHNIQVVFVGGNRHFATNVQDGFTLISTVLKLEPRGEGKFTVEEANSKVAMFLDMFTNTHGSRLTERFKEFLDASASPNITWRKG